MVENYIEKNKELTKANVKTIKNIGVAATDFMKMHDEAIADGSISKKNKELMALAIAIAVRCEGCIISHVNTCIELGATMEEISETVGVTLMMSGGPGMVYGGKAIEAAEQFLNK